MKNFQYKLDLYEKNTRIGGMKRYKYRLQQSGGERLMSKFRQCTRPSAETSDMPLQ